MMRTRGLVLSVLAALAVSVPAASLAGASVTASVAGAPVPAADELSSWPRWAAVMVAGDASITAFDNGIDAVGAELAERGVEIVATLRASDGTATRADLRQAMGQLAANDSAGCLVYLTSHGNETGFLLSLEGNDLLRPEELDALVDAGCGARPTAVVISACHSGTFVPDLAAPNRVIITAARTERSSFGCSPDAVYTFFDGCILETLPAVDGWEQLYAGALACVERQETELGYLASEPQLATGVEMSGAALPVSLFTWIKQQQG